MSHIKPGRRTTLVSVVAATALTISGVSAAEASGPDQPDQAPLLGVQADTAIEGRYIVVMKDRTPSASAERAKSQAKAAGGRVDREFSHALRGFTGSFNAKALDALRRNPNVAFVEADQRVTVDATQSPATWGLDRIDQTALPLSGSYTYSRNGAGVTAYIIDTGIRPTHTQFTGRIGSGFTAITDGNGTNDCNGHGTHVAGTVGGSTYGVAKAVSLRPVRVLGCDGSGTTAGVIAGVDWVTANRTGPSVANMSLGGGVSTALDTAVTNAINSGVTFAVAAGNENTNACNGSPSRVPSALTVGATTNTDARSSFSNFGTCLDLFAPGSSITSAWMTGDSATNTISGTSMATPHVAGVAALYLEANPAATPAAVGNAIIGSATTGKVTSPGTGSPNRLLYSLIGATPPPPPSSNLLVNPGFESGTTGWAATAGVITTSSARPAHGGSWKAWLNGYGAANTDTVTQSVTIPSASSATLSLWLRIDSAETSTTTAYDKMRVQIVSGGTTTTLATYSNLNKSGYVKKTFNLTPYVGKTVTVKLVATEDASLQTSFVVDDTLLTTS